MSAPRRSNSTKKEPSQINLHTTNPDYDKQLPKYQLWEDLYSGSTLIEKNAKYLIQHPWEPLKQYDIRKDRAVYRNFAAPIAHIFSSSIWRKAPDRESFPEVLKPFIKNVDRNNKAANEFFQEVTERAAAIGIQFVVVDNPKGRPQTQAEAKRQGIRPYFVLVQPHQLIDWGFDDDGSLSYVVIYEEVETQSEAFVGHTVEAQWKLWTKTEWKIYIEQETVKKSGEKKNVAVLKESGTHGIGEVPIAAFYFRKKTRMVGGSCLRDVDTLCMRIYRRDSELDKMLFDSAITLWFFKGFSADQLTEFVMSTSNGLRSDSVEAGVECVEPPGNSFKAITESIDKDERTIREIALRMIRPDSRQVESAESKKLDKQPLDSQLSLFSKNIENGERRCWQLALKWLNRGGNEELELQYNRDFDVETISESLINALLGLRRNQDISRETLWELLKRGEILGDDFNQDEEATRLELEQRSRGRFPDLGKNFL